MVNVFFSENSANKYDQAGNNKRSNNDIDKDATAMVMSCDRVIIFQILNINLHWTIRER